jgi:uncharacterized protein YjbI with pentapeptide repeats
LFVLVFPKVLRPGLSADEQAKLEQQGIDKLVAAQTDRSNAQNNVRTTLLQGIAGAALLTGAYFAYRQLHTAIEGQITTRYTEAVKQLGDDHVDVRVGGICALGRIARDSHPDEPTIADLLSTFVHRAVVAEARTDAGREASTPLPEHSPDVYAALEVLARHGGANVEGCHLEGAHLSLAVLTGANLKGGHLKGVNLRRADLTGADLTGADLTGAHLTGAHLDSAKNADFSHTVGLPAFWPDGSSPGKASEARPEEDPPK